MTSDLGWPDGPSNASRRRRGLNSEGLEDADASVSRETSIAPAVLDSTPSDPPSNEAGSEDVSRETPADTAEDAEAERDTWDEGARMADGEGSRDTPILDTTAIHIQHEIPGDHASPATLATSPAPDPEAQVSRETPSAGVDLTPTMVEPGVWPRPRHRRVMAIANQKGGVGKTTSTVNLAAALAQHGVRVLVIDLDPQGNASTAFSVEHAAGTASIYDVLIGETTLAEVCVPVEGIPNLWCAPATIDLAGAEIELVSVVARESRLRRALDSVADLDYVLIDCPPSLGLLTLNAMVAAGEVLIPIQCEFYALEGLTQLLNNVDLVKKHLNSELAVSTILLTMYDARTRLAEQVANEVRSHFRGLVLESVIPRSVRISEAPGFGQTVVTFDSTSRGAKSYIGAAYDLARRADPAESLDES